MYIEIECNDFDYLSFLAEHRDDFIIIVWGSWKYEDRTGSYKYQTIYGTRSTSIREKRFNQIKSSNMCMLEAILNACERIKIEGKQVFVLSPTSLGFRSAESRNGVNEMFIQKIFQVCSEKKLTLNVISLHNGGGFIKNLLV